MARQGFGARWAALADRVRTSLFFVPTAFVVGGILLAQLGIALDARIDDGSRQLPLVLTSTVESARAVLSTIAGATITVAGIAFSVSLLVIQLASSQYSPRVVHGLFRDPFNKRVMGIVVGTFTYCLVVLRSVRSPLDPGGDAVVPNLSVALAVVLGVTSVLAVIAFINHSAHAMDVSEILDVVTNEALGAVDDTWPERAGSPSTPSLPLARPELGVDPSVFAARADGFHVRFDRDGWVQYVDAEALALAVPDGSVVRFESAAGRYAVAGTPMCSVWPCPDDPDEATRSLRRAVGTGAARTLAQDAAYGIRQLVDVALKALSPGVNDPTTAQDAIVHLGTVLAELLRRDPPPRRCRIRGRTVLFPELPDHEDLIELAFGELRRAAAPYPAVCGYLWATIDQLIRAGDDRLAPGTVEMLRAHGRRVLATAERSGLADDDRADLQRAYERRLASPATAPSPA